jgi:uncharacterized protein YgiM (DUF1202 family)
MKFWAVRSTGTQKNPHMSMKQNVCSVTALVLLLTMGGTAMQSTRAEASPQGPATAISTAVTKIAASQYKTTIHLNLRSGAGTNYSIIGSGITGTTVAGTGKANGIWYEVKLGSQTGWMSSEYLKKVTTPAPVTKITVAQYKTTIHLNLRSGAGTSYSVIGSGVAGTTVTGTGKANGIWYEVKLGSQTGWMSSEYLKKVPTPTAAAVTPPITTVLAVQYKTKIHLMLRSGAGTNYNIIGSGVMGTTVTGTGKSNGIWYQVKLGSKTGWMSSDYLQAVTGPNSIASLQAFAGSKLNNPQQLQCLVTLWNRESNWNYKAINPAFSPSKPNTPAHQAYGIAQAAPGSKMTSAGADWQTNPRTQIVWGLDYIKTRYGTPCSALNHSNLRGWY